MQLIRITEYQPPGGTRERPAFLLPKSERSGSVETRVIKLADIKPAPYNPRVQLTPKDQEYKALDASM